MHRLMVGVWLWLASGVAFADVAVPPPLQDWQAWVLHDHPQAACPFMHNAAARQCVWPSRLAIEAHDQGGRFQFEVQVFARTWVRLPGSDAHWPQAVSADQTPLAVVRREGRPAVELQPGRYQLQGQWRWQQMPRSLLVPEQAGLLSLTVGGRTLSQLNLSDDGALWLAAEPRSVGDAITQDSLQIKVFRRIEDGNPLVVETWLQLDVSGREREVQTGPMLLPGFVPRAFDSDLPARVEPDGRLRVQLKPGRWNLRLRAHQNQPLEQLSYARQDELWPEEELWVFVAEPRLRTVQIEQAPAVDPSQTPLPDEWQGLPAYRMSAKGEFVLNVLHRGDPNPPSNQLSLNKSIWLGFDGKTSVVKDEINGRINQDWRLEVVSPYQLGGADLHGQPLLVTRLSESGAAGVELRQPHIGLSAVSQIAKARKLPVSGWKQNFEQVEHTWHLPPGWSLLHISGADQVLGTWLARWNLWNLFLVLLIAVSLGRVSRPVYGLLALITLLLTFQRQAAPVLAWLNIALILALLPWVKGRLAGWVRGYGLASFGVLILLLLPFVAQQSREAVYPQLAEHSAGHFPPQPLPAQPETMAMDSGQQLQELAVRSESYVRTRSKALAEPAPGRPGLLYDPKQTVQVGPGLPEWQWRSVYARWSGPVQASETLNLFLVSPLFNRLGSLLSAVLPLLLAGLLLRYFLSRRAARGKAGKLSGSAAGAALLVLACGVLPVPPSQAEVLLDSQILQDLEKRLLEPAKCLPECAAIESADLQLDDNDLQLRLTLHATAHIAFPLPSNTRDGWPQTITAGQRLLPVLQRQGGQLYVYLPPGRHQLELSGSLHGRDNVTLAFGMPLHNLQQRVSGWQLSGAPSDRQTSHSLQLSRQRQATADDRDLRLLPEPIPPYVTVTRQLQLGLDWRVTTEVRRVAPETGVINLAVPLLPGESPLEGQQNADGSMDVRLAAGQAVARWQSSLRQTHALTLAAPRGATWAEVWVLEASPIWHTRFDGIEPLQGSAEDARPMWQPWPGETLSLAIDKPQAVDGAHRVVEQVNLKQQFGRRASELSLTLRIRATQSAPFELTLPEEAELKRVMIDGRERPISHSRNRLQIPLQPGTQTVEVHWQTLQELAMLARSPSLDLGSEAANINLLMQLPRDRWPLLAGGPSLGPVVLFWSLLLLVLALALALGRSRLTPVRTYQWVLLSLGIATVHLYLLALLAAWFVVLHLRGQTPPHNKGYNAVQLALFVFSLLALGALLASVPYSLLASPQMYITGNASSSHYLQWYQDRVHGQLPGAWVISLPMWVYRLIMLLWSIWLAFTLVGWVQWAWKQLGVGGYWRKKTANARPGDAVDQKPDGTP